MRLIRHRKSRQQVCFLSDLDQNHFVAAALHCDGDKKKLLINDSMKPDKRPEGVLDKLISKLEVDLNNRNSGITRDERNRMNSLERLFKTNGFVKLLSKKPGFSHETAPWFQRLLFCLLQRVFAARISLTQRLHSLSVE